MRKKNDKIVLMFIILFVFFVLSWIIEAGTFNLGVYESSGFVRLGLIDFVAVVFSSIISKVDFLYLLVIGGCYGVLSQTKSYRKLVDKTSELIDGKENMAMAVITLVTGLYASICNEVLVLFCISPFIISVFLRNRYDKLTAFNAGFGGALIGILGITVGTYGVGTFYTVTGVSPSDSIPAKIVTFIVAYVLYNIFAIRHMDNHADADEQKSDMFYPEKLDETDLKKRYKAKVAPILICGIISMLMIFLAYISWNESFGIAFFNDLHNTLGSLITIGDVNLLSSLYGVTAHAFGAYDALLFAIFIMLIFTTIIALVDKMKLNTFMAYFGRGVKRILKVVFIYVLAYSVVIIARNFPWANTIVHWMFGDGFANVLLLLLMGFVAQIFVGNLGMFGDVHGSFIAYAFADNIGEASFLWRLGGAMATIVAPTSFLLLALLTYLDIPYVDWLKYIWKFMLSFVLVILILFIVILFI